MEYKRNCPKCDKELTYTDKSNFNRAVKNNSVCANCRKMPESLKKTISEYWTGKKKPNYKRIGSKGKFSRLCPDCNKELFYTRIDNYNKAIKNNSKCNHCAKLNDGEIDA